MSLRRFEGWEPTTFYVHDEGGRLVSSTPEPEWDDVEQAWMLALALYRRTRCGRCGGDLVETTDSRNEGRYVPLLPVQCHRCVGLEQSEDGYREAPHPYTLMHRVELRR